MPTESGLPTAPPSVVANIRLLCSNIDQKYPEKGLRWGREIHPGDVRRCRIRVRMHSPTTAVLGSRINWTSAILASPQDPGLTYPKRQKCGKLAQDRNNKRVNAVLPILVPHGGGERPGLGSKCRSNLVRHHARGLQRVGSGVASFQ